MIPGHYAGFLCTDYTINKGKSTFCLHIILNLLITWGCEFYIRFLNHIVYIDRILTKFILLRLTLPRMGLPCFT